MNIVLIAGAGASRAEAISLGLEKEKHPPLDTDFFELADKYANKSDLITAKNYLRDVYSIDINGNSVRMEEVFGLVYADTLTVPTPVGAKKAFSCLCKIYNKVIAETTNNLEINSNNPLYRLVEKISENNRLTIMTFNQDLVLERTVEKISEANGNELWCLDSGYDMDFGAITEPSEADPETIFRRSANQSNIKILKMHGSLNWYGKTVSRDRIPSKLNNKKDFFAQEENFSN